MDETIVEALIEDRKKIYVSQAFMGLKVLEREKEVFKEHPKNQPD